ncbi:EAL domain-containing protein [Agarivorans sp. Z349TD_8]|uniref:EAL domain-containing protein n=1 Tax=Agarivorans sp. Z349TD_8 TaxID=3421434 RepID=UPI003D7D6D1E
MHIFNHQIRLTQPPSEHQQRTRQSWFSSRHVRPILFTLICSLLPIVMSYSWTLAHTKQQRREAFAQQFELSYQAINQNLLALHHYFIGLDRLDINCAPETLLALRKVHFQITYVAELGLVDQSGQLRCSSWGPVNPPYEVLKPVANQQLRYYGPSVLEYSQEVAMIIAKTRSNGSEINAAIPLSVFKAFVQGNDNKQDLVALVDSNNGTPLFVNGHYSLPLQHGKTLFPLTQSVIDQTAHFDDSNRRYYLAKPFSALPGLSLLSTRTEQQLYLGAHRLSLLQVALYLLLICGIFYFIQRQQGRRLSQKSQLKTAIRNQEFINYYQAIWDSRTGRLIGVELLARWLHPIDGIRSPDSFLPDIQRYRLQVALTEQLLATLKTDLNGLLTHNALLKININITGQHLNDPEFVVKLLAIHQTCRQICLEITETQLVDIDSPQVQDALSKLQTQGVKLAIDDFGTGYAGLQYLQQLPLDTLKIDRSFVAAIHTDSPQAKVLDGVIDLALNLNLQIVAEGVETEAQAQYLRDKGVYLHQGWLYSKAGPIEDLLTLTPIIEPPAARQFNPVYGESS